VTDDSAGAVHRYLSLAGSNGTFTSEVLKLLLEENRMVAREKINEGRHQVVYKIDDVVTVRVQVQSDSSRNRVGKLLYKSK
jgi:acyl dehydratase